MSKLRSVNTHFWNDNFVIDLDPIEKLLFLYLLTNPNTNMLGIYELHIRKISFDTGIDKDMVTKIFDRFDDAGKASYVDGFVCLHNFTKHQSYNTNMKVSAINSFNELPLGVRKQHFCKPLLKALKPFPKDSKPIAEYELEYEEENEVEVKDKTLLSDLSSDEFNAMGDVDDKIDWTTVRLHEKFRDRFGHYKTIKKATLEDWRDPIRLMHSEDGLGFEHIWKLIKHATTNDFWKDTIKSTSGLRNNWEELDSSIRRDSNKKSKQGSSEKANANAYVNDYTST